MNQNSEYLRLLSIFHYVLGGITFLFSFFPIFHLAIGVFMLSIDPESIESDADASAIEEVESANNDVSSDSPLEIDVEVDLSIGAKDGGHEETSADELLVFRFMGAAFTLIASLIMLMGFALSISMIVAGRKLQKQQAYTFCMVIAGIECILFPIHTALGVCTILLLMKPDVRTLFGLSSLSAPGGNYEIAE